MFWEVSGIDSEVIGLLWNLSFLEYSIGLFFLGLFLAFIVLLFSSPLGHSLFLTLIPDCCLCLQIHRCINFISSWVYDHTIAIPVLIVPMSQDGSTTRSDFPADGQEELGGFSQSERMMADMMKMMANMTMQKQQLLQQHLQLQQQTTGAADSRGLQSRWRLEMMAAYKSPVALEMVASSIAVVPS